MTKDEVLSRTQNGLSVFRCYLKGNLVVGKNFRNPFYEDKNASCNVYFDKLAGVYKIKDFGNPDYDGDCFAFVAKIKNLDCRNDFNEILGIINQDLGLYLDNVQNTSKSPPKEPMPQLREQKQIPEQEDRTEFDLPEIKEFSDSELAWWAKSNISIEMLKYFRVTSVAELSGTNKQGKPFSFKSSEHEPIFAYTVNKTSKFYLPFSKIRFLYGSKKQGDYVFGLEQLPLKGETVFITGGEKDVMSLYAHGFSAVCFNSETAAIPVKLIKNLSYRFKHIVLLYDCDKTGLEASERHTTLLKAFDVKRLVLPLSGTKTDKDITDYFAKGNKRKDLLRLFLNVLKQRYENTFALLKPCAINWDNPPIRPDPLLTINNVVVASPSNLVCISGSEGSGKSNYIGAVVAGALNTFGEEIDTLGTYIAPNHAGKALLIYDTEQTEDQLYRNMKNILRRAYIDKPPKWFKAFSIGNIARKERIRAIVESMDSFHYYFGGIHLVVIDGIADLITSVNDEAESVMLVEELYRLAGFYKTCIMVVLHLAPSAYKLRGHLGSEIQRKAAGVLCIEKNETTGNAVIKAIKVREGNPMDVPQLQFAWDNALGYHVLVDTQTARSESAGKTELIELADGIFAGNAELSYSDLLERIQNRLGIKERQAKNYIKILREKGFITQELQKNNRYMRN